MQRPRRPGRLGPPLLLLLLLLAGSLAACGVPAPLQRQRPALPPATGTESGRAIAAPTNPAPPIEPAPAATMVRHGTLEILAPGPGARLNSRSLVVIGVAPSGAQVVLDGPLFLDRRVAADPWGAWSMALTLDPGRHDLVFELAGRSGSQRTLSLEVADAVSTAPVVAWPPDGTPLAADRATLRGTAAPGARVAASTDDPLGAIGAALGTARSTDADAAGRWTLDVDLEVGPNRLVIASGDRAIRHTVLRDDGASPTTGIAPELAIRSVRTLPFDDPETGPFVQVVVEVENASGGWLDLLGGAPPTAESATGRRAALLPFPRRVAPGHTALLLGELRPARPDDPGADLPTADDFVLAIDVGYASAPTPAQGGHVESYRLSPTPGGLSVTGRFRAGSTEPRFRIAILGYDAAGSLVAVATTPPARPGRYEACCLPLVDAGARTRLARLVGLVSGD